MTINDDRDAGRWRSGLWTAAVQLWCKTNQISHHHDDDHDNDERDDGHDGDHHDDHHDGEDQKKCDMKVWHRNPPRWEPPAKNPHSVELYRVFWRPVRHDTNYDDDIYDDGDYGGHGHGYFHQYAKTDDYDHSY